jgi:hypothetical protein
MSSGQLLLRSTLTNAPLIYINGFPDIGKLTVARKIVKPCNAAYPRDHVDYQKKHEAERERHFEEVGRTLNSRIVS